MKITPSWNISYKSPFTFNYFINYNYKMLVQEEAFYNSILSDLQKEIISTNITIFVTPEFILIHN